MSWLRNRHYWLPITLGLLGVLLLLRVLFVNTLLPVQEDVDVIVLAALLGIALTVAIHTIVRISMSHLRLRSIRQVRRETLAEHRRFLSRLDHELKNPLTALRTGLRTLVLTTLNEQQQQIVETMEIETLRLSRLVADLRKLAELETQPLDLRPIRVKTFVRTIVQMEQERFAAGGRTLHYTIDADEQALWVADEDLLALAVHNLLDNAFKYSRPGDATRLSVCLSVAVQQELTIQVSDTGIGIPQSALPHIWEELYRAQQMEKIPGSGTGLALVRAIVERHNGTVSMESEPGQGTTSTIRLPNLSQL